MTQRQLFLRHLAQTSDAPLALEIVRGEGVYLYDADGKKYLDLISGISVSSLGHGNKKVIQAIEKQANKYLHTLVYGEFVLAPQVALANLLTKQLPSSLDSVYLVNSGTEATEAALKLAKRTTGRYEIISCKNAYHGSTQGAMSLMSDEYFTGAYRPLLPQIKHIDFNCLACLERITTATAAVIIEPVQAEWGVRAADSGYLQALRNRCNETDTLLIFDEIQVGMGRTGTLFAFEQHGVTPDILLLAKAFGGGMPLGAMIASKEIMQAFTHNPVLGHITTFGGHPVCSAAALANLEVLLASDYIGEVKNKETLFHSLLVHKDILDIRSAGLIMAIDLDSEEKVMKTIRHCIELGLITDWFLFNARCLRVAPPLTISNEEIAEACRIILRALDE